MPRRGRVALGPLGEGEDSHSHAVPLSTEERDDENTVPDAGRCDHHSPGYPGFSRVGYCGHRHWWFGSSVPFEVASRGESDELRRIAMAVAFGFLRPSWPSTPGRGYRRDQPDGSVGLQFAGQPIL
jgi:hypothetical protein